VIEKWRLAVGNPLKPLAPTTSISSALGFLNDAEEYGRAGGSTDNSKVMEIEE
jgi:hypothetical protein